MTDKPKTFLAEAAWQVLDDMGKTGQCCSELAKARLRLALVGETVGEEFDVALDYTVIDAHKTVQKCEALYGSRN